ncbi:MAG TPA: hypothetical protein VFS00_08195, partial [Polyangiaceae bacterium]|nr:hypothetical protein [Polyangiaceae bacterium]
MAEIESKLAEHGLPFARHHVKRLDREGVVEVVHGVERSARLRRRYHVGVEQGLGATVAADLLADPLSPVAPILQVLMTRLYARAREAGGDAPAFTSGLYTDLRREGLLLEDFLERQLKALPEGLRPHLDAGLVDDLLEAHTTASGTAATLTRADLEARYAHVKGDAQKLVEAMRDRGCSLLTGPSDDPPAPGAPAPAGPVDPKTDTRLAHDTLALLVRKRFHASERPGQRARRLLELRTGGRKEGADGDLLSPKELAIVEAGARAMRRPDDHERKLLAESRAEAERREQKQREDERAEQQRRIEAERSARRQRWAFGAVAALAALAIAVVAWKLKSDQDAAKVDLSNEVYGALEKIRQEQD